MPEPSRAIVVLLAATRGSAVRLGLTLAVLAAFGVFATVVAWHSGRELAAVYGESARSEALAVARAFASDFDPAPARGSPGGFDRRLESLRERFPNLVWVALYVRRDGATVRLALARAPGVPLPAPRSIDWPSLGAARYRTEREPDGHAADLAYPLRDGRGRALGLLELHVDLAGFDSALAHSRRQVLLIALVTGALLSVSFLFLVATAVFRPLARLRRAMSRVAEGALEERLAWKRRDELGLLAQDFDGMVGQLADSRRRLESLALEDPLTGLANHRRLHETLAEELKRAQLESTPLAVIALDLDHFKRLNDTYGHPYGDEILRATGERLAGCVRPGDLVARVGGEEFMIVVPRADLSTGRQLAERARAAVAEVRTRDGPLSCSAGIACYPADAWSAASLLELADAALYAAKRSGRGQARHVGGGDPRRRAGEQERFEVEALLARPGALTAVFQPFLALATGEVVGYEALTRFPGAHPQRPPDAFFAQAHRCGLGAALEAAAIRTALEQPGRPPDAALSLNVSPSALLSPEVGAVLPADLSGVVLEITEHERLADDPAALETRLDELRQRGARLAFDDAGAGYAGLQHLMRLRPDIIKLDRTLVAGICEDEAKRALVESFGRFAARTGADLCAEGVEHLEDLRVLAELRVTYGQGYALARPSEGWVDVPAAVAAYCRDHFGAGQGVRSAPDAAEPLSADEPLDAGPARRRGARSGRPQVSAAVGIAPPRGRRRR